METLSIGGERMTQDSSEAFSRKLVHAALTPVLVGFTLLTAVALWQHGYWGILAPHFKSSGAAQVLVDLVIALSLVLAWMWPEAKRTNRRFWPWFLLTLVLGSFGPLLFLAFGKRPKK